jgi:PRC-barrel domain
VPPCLPEVAKPKVAVKRRPRPAQGTEKPTPVEPQPPRLGSSTPEVKAIDASVASILGKKVQGADAGDLGRVVDVQADGDGRVRLVIIEFGGFLGVGNRRAAVDWGLLQFHPDEPDRPITLSVSAKQVQGTPEYRQTSHPQALMAPTAVPATDSPPASPSAPAPASPPAPSASPADTSPPQTGSAPPQTK